MKFEQTIDIRTTGNMQDILWRMETLPGKMRREIWQDVSKKLLDLEQPLPITKRQLKRLDHLFSGQHAWECLRSRWFVEQGQIGNVNELIRNQDFKRKIKTFVYLAKIFYIQNELQLAIGFAEKAYSMSPNNKLILRRLVSIHHRLGNITKRLFYLKRLQAQSGRLFVQEFESAADEKGLLKQGWQWEFDPIPLEQGSVIVHVLNKSLPEINGYTVRSAEIMKHQMEGGLHPIAVTKLGWPPGDQVQGWIRLVHDQIDHYHLYDRHQTQLNKAPMSEYFHAYANSFASLMKEIKPRLIHAASNFQNALPPLSVAKKMGIPSVYEVRGMWHYTQSSKTKGFENSERYRLHEKFELLCCTLADRIVTISESLQRHLLHLGVDSSKIHIIPNAVNIKEFHPIPPNPELKEKYGLNGQRVVGFVGSIEGYEGLDFLIKAFAYLKEQQENFKLLIVGEGSALSRLQQLTATLKVEEMVVFVGKVPRNQVADYYSVIDICPFPRTKAKVCELVTPLKPYEAMAMGKIVMISDIPALREMVVEGQTGLVFKSEDAASLADCLIQADQHKYVGQQAREWVVKNRNWHYLISKYKEVY